ncbi:Ig-like domain-containing protein [Chitinophaga rhizophila]|uniref:Ig-like domain-containing protein n=1 Tax=Chitinophaga rhizophila TaxID=2866212 RepID=A0ABS7GEY2_9BACT|nr:Ig-like domain-containing protein [Chitinophaga rhizophila]MBW8686245.1 Ig-like domain-containing protein [Chitinophaga rhizophila]
MMTHNFRCWAVWLLVISACIYLIPGCANIVPPSGGPKDTLAPRVVNISPADSTLHFNSKKVYFTFNEFVQVDNVFEKLIVSPTLKRTPTVTYKLRTVTMEIKDTLQENTTYTFNFSDAVRDNNESNPIQDFQYVVSTGDYLDSLQVRGFIIDAQTGRPDSNVSVMIYRSDVDSVVSKEKPVYFARSKGNGSFWFRNMAPGDYKLFALKEEDRDLQYNQPKEMIAFNDSLLHLREQNLSDITMLLFTEQDSTLKKPDDMQTDAEVAQEEADKREEEKEKEKDKKKRRILNISPDLADNRQELGKPLLVTFSAPLKTFDSTAFTLTQDTLFTPVEFTTSMDSTRTKLYVNYDWKEGKPYRLIIPKESVADTTGLQPTKSDTISFAAKKESDYGKAMLTLVLSDSAKANISDTMHYVAQLVVNKEIKYAGKVVNGTWIQKRITPAEYEVYILLDENNNGKWDRGVYYGTPKKQPERVVSFPKKENIKANWGVKIRVNI